LKIRHFGGFSFAVTLYVLEQNYILIHMIRNQLSGFVHFIRTQGVAGFAIGFILGKAISDLVASLVNDIINPIIGLGLKNFGDLSQLSWKIGESTIAYGKFISLFINFVIVAAVVYFGIKKLSDLLDKPKDAPVPGVQNK
jgi:large conductance mechanosensitive channel